MSEPADPRFSMPMFVNPLAFLDVDQPWAPGPDSDVTADRILDFMCPPGVPSDPESLTQRYQQISTEERRLSSIPSEPELLATVAWPLRHAKAAFITGNYSATIALSGTVGEALAVLLFRISQPRLGDGPMDDQAQDKVFGKKFFRLGQFRRLQVLLAFRLTDDAAHERFDRLRDIRNKYVHHIDRSGRDEAHDAVTAFSDAVWLACFVLGLDFNDGAVVLRPEMTAHLRMIGFIKGES